MTFDEQTKLEREFNVNTDRMEYYMHGFCDMRVEFLKRRHDHLYEAFKEHVRVQEQEHTAGFDADGQMLMECVKYCEDIEKILCDIIAGNGDPKEKFKDLRDAVQGYIITLPVEYRDRTYSD